MSSVKSAVAYFRENMGIGDYLSEDGRAELVWYGSGAERLGLRGRSVAYRRNSRICVRDGLHYWQETYNPRTGHCRACLRFG